MPQYYYTYYNKEKIQLASKAFAGGGEGDLYKITAPASYKKYVAKIYHPHKQTEQREHKTQYLIENPPLGLTENGSIVWIVDALYDSKDKFVGFIMPFIKGEKLEVLCLGKLPRKLDNKWNRFDLKHSAAFQLRLRTCFNLATAIYQMHATDNYVLVDMKPDNIIIQSNGLLGIVDTDSVEVIENGVAIFPAPVATPEYTPPEFYSDNFREHSTVGESWDRFGLAVIIYKLMFGIHPFTASAGPPYDNLVSLHEKIEVGLFVHSISKKHHLKVIPPPHKAFDLLNEELQHLFMRCFEDGHENPDARPSANEWCSALLYAIGDPKLEEHFAHILGLAGHSIGGKFKLPSTVFKQMNTEHATRKLVATTINATFEQPPVLPPKLQKNIHLSGDDQANKKSLQNSDYIISWSVTLIIAVVVFSVFSSSMSWLLGDFWLSSTWLINLILIGVLFLPQVVGSRLVYIIRAHLNEAKDLSGFWKEFQTTYPQLIKNTSLAKQEILNRVMNEQAEIDRLNTQKMDALEPVTTYIEVQDKKVQTLAEAYELEVQKLDQDILQKALKNELLAELEVSQFMELSRKLELLHQSKTGQIEGIARMGLNSHPEHAQILQAFAKKKTTYQDDKEIKKAILNKTNLLFDINYLIDQEFEETDADYRKMLKHFFAEKELHCIFNVGMIFPGKGSLRFMYFNEKQNKEILVSIEEEEVAYKALKKLYTKYKVPIEDLKEKGVKTKTDYSKRVTENYKTNLQQKLDRLKDVYQGKIDELLALSIKEKHRELIQQVETARQLIRQLKEEKRKTLKPLQEAYGKEYTTVLEACQKKTDEGKQALLDLEEDQKMAIRTLLENPETKKMKTDLQLELEQAKVDLVVLKDYDPSK